MEDITLRVVFVPGDAPANAGPSSASAGGPLAPAPTPSLDFVSREEFDAERQSHLDTRKRLEKLTDRVGRLESVVDALLVSRRQRRQAQRTGFN